MSDVMNYIDLNALADGAFAEKLNKAIEEVARNACGMMVVTLDGLPGYAVDGLELVEEVER